jgi:hypothetical protein
MASLQSLFPKAINLHESKDPMRNLWRNVLIVALEDALGRHALNKNYGYSRSSSAELSRSYFTEPNGDFKMVCTFAGFDHEYIRMKAKQFFNRKKKENDLSKM